jgi:hypothetical protein
VWVEVEEFLVEGRDWVLVIRHLGSAPA